MNEPFDGMQMADSDHPAHVCTVRELENRQWQITCTCGAIWMQDPDTTTETMLGIYNGHVDSFKR